ncbi:hypothetical protein E3T33_07065 [Cryobacterium sp. TMT1-2-1]|uniref:hypothetical protein n=1 Tax=Cryobacterium sp. TMT1-2-1 TaxID=1259232 RepID=UPI00106AF287|nr:hypothetical protein [Cryobacterium sp. TMT1-2-1]TFD45563.1 hypothetical protein E3T33_07065 [Cryobacterium sp. TMT1-2-1]
MAYPLITERLSIAPLAGADAVAFARYRQEPGVALYQSWSTDFSEAAALSIVAGQPAGDLPGAVLRKAGLRQECRQVEADWFKGEWTTLDTYALLGREWPRGAARG